MSEAGKKSEDDNHNKILVGGGISAAVVVTMCLMSWCVIGFCFPEGTDRGQFGDSFGALNAMFSGLAFVGVVVAIVLQREEILNQRKDISNQREDIAIQTRALDAQVKESKSMADAMKAQVALMSKSAELQTTPMITIVVKNPPSLKREVMIGNVLASMKDSLKLHTVVEFKNVSGVMAVRERFIGKVIVPNAHGGSRLVPNDNGLAPNASSTLVFDTTFTSDSYRFLLRAYMSKEIFFDLGVIYRSQFGKRYLSWMRLSLGTPVLITDEEEKLLEKHKKEDVQKLVQNFTSSSLFSYSHGHYRIVELEIGEDPDEKINEIVSAVRAEGLDS